MKENQRSVGVDPSLQPSQLLDTLLKTDANSAAQSETKISVAKARSGTTQADIVSNRTTTRILFISQDTTLLNQATKSLDGYLNVADMFNEVHIIVLQPGIRTKHPVLRVSDNVWIYVASATHAWWTPVIALRIIRDNLVFAGGFRPDLIVARDCYESALLASIISKRYERPTQLHILSGQSLAGVSIAPRSFFWRHLSGWILSTFKSIRTTTQVQVETLKRNYPHVTDIAALPKFHNFNSGPSSAPVTRMKDIYKDFAFILLYVGPLTIGRNTYHAIDAARGLLRNPRVGLVILGDGPARTECIKRVSLLGMSSQVVFEKRTELLDDYIASADVVFVTDSDAASEEVVLQSAVLGRPLVAVKTIARTDLLTDGESVLFFKEGDIDSASRLLHRVLDDIALRRTLSDNIKAVAMTRIHDDPLVYQQLYRDSIEAALFLSDEDNTAS